MLGKRKINELVLRSNIKDEPVVVNLNYSRKNTPNFHSQMKKRKLTLLANLV